MSEEVERAIVANYTAGKTVGWICASVGLRFTGRYLKRDDVREVLAKHGLI